ncbi:MAG: HAD family phosphatase [Candidatus Omnitrophica bacterium]|nr:HAD family phosphatase [Candidatus Omnitrophota bacterium]
MKDKINTVLFDLGRVLVNFDHAIAAERIAPFTGKTAEEVYGMFFDSALTRLFEAGKISPEGFFSEVKHLLDLKLDYGRFVPLWNEIFFLTEENRRVYELAKGLKDSYKTAMLSNINVLHFRYLKNNFPVFDAFHKVFLSYELGFIKPDPRIYKKVLEQLNVPPSEVFYVDDRPELIEEAGGLGIRAFVYKGIGQLKEDLSGCGLKIPG